MNKKKIEISLPEGKFKVNVLEFNKPDKKILFDLYKNWRNTTELSKLLYGRCINIPESLSEGAFCLITQSFRMIENIPKANSSFDCYNIHNNKRIQVKACATKSDLTSFGPKSIWDELYFLDFYNDGEFNGKFDIYLIDDKFIYDHKVNINETFKDQQNQKRRPRIRIKEEIIISKNLKPIISATLSK